MSFDPPRRNALADAYRRQAQQLREDAEAVLVAEDKAALLKEAAAYEALAAESDK